MFQLAPHHRNTLIIFPPCTRARAFSVHKRGPCIFNAISVESTHDTHPQNVSRGCSIAPHRRSTDGEERERGASSSSRGVRCVNQKSFIDVAVAVVVQFLLLRCCTCCCPPRLPHNICILEAATRVTCVRSFRVCYMCVSRQCFDKCKKKCYC